MDAKELHMDAKELHDALSANPTSGTEIAVLAAANMVTILRALSLLAAGEPTKARRLASIK